MAKSTKSSLAERRRNARIRAMQALYQQDIAGGDIGEILTQFHETQELDRVDVPFFEELFRGVVTHIDELDDVLTPLLDRKIEDLDAVERAILHLAGFELKERLDTPYKVVINESVELAKKFGAEQGHKYVNGVVDKLAKRYRTLELSAGKLK